MPEYEVFDKDCIDATEHILVLLDHQIERGDEKDVIFLTILKVAPIAVDPSSSWYDFQIQIKKNKQKFVYLCL